MIPGCIPYSYAEPKCLPKPITVLTGDVEYQTGTGGRVGVC
jgi:hypothetical protein